MDRDEQGGVAELFFQLNSDALANSLAGWARFLKLYAVQLEAAGFEGDDVLKLLHLLNVAALSGGLSVPRGARGEREDRV